MSFDVSAGRAASWRNAPFWAGFAAFAPALILFCVGAVDQIMVPGIYMDAVNPDYMVVRLLNPGTDVPVWALPGTLLFHVFPVLGQIYHGALPYYIGLPVYALLGTGIVGIRLANLLFGLLVLLAACAFLRAFGVRNAIAGTCIAALALDPGYLFCFRTQFYITVLPLALLLTSLALVELHREKPSPRVASGAGLLAGLAIYGYFIHGFFVPVAAFHAWWRWKSARDRHQLYAGWVAGAGIGVAPYVLGCVLIFVATGGMSEFIAFLRAYLHGLGVTTSPLSLIQRANYFATMVWWTLLGVGPVKMMTHESPPTLLAGFHSAVLLVLPAFGVLVSLFRGARSIGLLVAMGLFCGAAVLFGTFGNRLWLHHAAPLLPIFYVALALTLELAVSTIGARHIRLASAAAVAIVVPLIVANTVNQQSVLFDLARTGGVGLASDAIEHFAEDSLRGPSSTYAFFPDWGVFMPFEMITRGRVPLATDFTPEAARRTLCGGQDVLLGLVNGPGLDRLPAWTDSIDWGQPDQTIYRQRDGVPVLTAIRWHAAASGHKACTT